MIKPLCHNFSQTASSSGSHRRGISFAGAGFAAFGFRAAGVVEGFALGLAEADFGACRASKTSGFSSGNSFGTGLRGAGLGRVALGFAVGVALLASGSDG